MFTNSEFHKKIIDLEIKRLQYRPWLPQVNIGNVIIRQDKDYINYKFFSSELEITESGYTKKPITFEVKLYNSRIVETRFVYEGVIWIKAFKDENNSKINFEEHLSIGPHEIEKNEYIKLGWDLFNSIIY